MAVIDVLNVNNELFRVYVTWCSILLIKMILITLLTVFNRFKNKAMINPEDLIFAKDLEVKTAEDVERCRRAHLNDLENVVPFLIIGMFYIFTEPHVAVSCWLIRIVGVTRIAHTIVYALYPSQPARAIFFYISYAISMFMILSAAVYFFRL